VRDAVVFIGVAQEKAYAFNARRLPGPRVRFEFTRNKSLLPNYYYFYLDDSVDGVNPYLGSFFFVYSPIHIPIGN
jgi:hypothetical protein